VISFASVQAATPALIIGLLTALGGGVLIGLERERRKGRGPNRKPAGVRTFGVTAVAGALAQGLEVPGLVSVTVLAVGLMAALGYWRTRQHDPGLTTELALLATCLIGVLSMQTPQFGAPAALGLTMLLAARDRLHRFATRVLSEQELHDALMLGALALIVLPLMPKEPLPWLAGLRPHALLGLMLLLLGVQALGAVAMRLAGAQAGLAISGLLSGLVSSTATIAAMGARARQHPQQELACSAGAVLSSAATWMLAQTLLFALSPVAAWAALPMLAVGSLLALTSGALLAWQSRKHGEPSSDRADATSALRLREAFVMALLLSCVTLAISWAEQRFGAAGLYAVAALSALADAHAPVASLAALHASHAINTQALLIGVLLAIGCNSLTRMLVALLSDGRRFALRIAIGLAIAWLGATLTFWLMGQLTPLA